MHPYLFHAGHFALPSFGALAALGLMCGLLLSERAARHVGVDPAALWDAGLFAIVAAYALSRMLLIATYWRSFRAFPLLVFTVPSLTATGLWLTLLLTLAWLRWRRVPVLRALDAWAPCAALVWATLALGHFLEGSDPGVPAAWGVEVAGQVVREVPVALLVAVAAALLGWLLWHRLGRGGLPGSTAALGLGLAGVAQFLATFVREPGVRGPLGLDAIEWVAAGLMLAGAMLYMLACVRAGDERDAEPEHVAQRPAPPLRAV